MTQTITKYKIRNMTSGKFSNGLINLSYNDHRYFVKWSAKGKEWSSEKLLCAHLLKAAQCKIDMSAWEVVKLVLEPTKSIAEWFTPEMLSKVLTK